MVKNTAK